MSHGDRFAGRVVVITGAGSGIGRATALRFASDGARVVVADISTHSAAETAALVVAGGGTALAVSVDVSHEPDVERMIATAVDQFGTVDVLHNNAALMTTDRPDADIAELDVHVWDTKMAVNSRSVMLGCKHVAPIMRRAGRGAIVNTSSVSALVGTDVNAAYGASKAAIIGLTRYVATMLGGDGVRCNSVAPGLVLTERISATMSERQLAQYRAERLLPWAADPEDIAGVVAFLASDEARCITGQTIVVDSGTTTHRPRHAMLQWDATRTG